MLRKKGLKATSSCISLESLSHSSNTGDEDDDNDEVAVEENSGGASSSSLPTLATGANLTANTTNFIVEAKEKLQAHSQHMSQIFTTTKTTSETEFNNAPTTPQKHFANKQGNNLTGEKTDSYRYGAMVSPLGRKRVTKTAWRSPKIDSHRLTSFTSSPPRSNFSTSLLGSLRNPAEAPVVTKSNPDGKRLSNRLPRSSMSQISLSYQDTTKEKTTPQQLQRKPGAVGFSSLPLARKGRNQTQPPSTTSSSKQFNSKCVCCACIYACM